MSSKKLLCVLLALSMMLMMLAGCGGSDPDPNENPYVYPGDESFMTYYLYPEDTDLTYAPNIVLEENDDYNVLTNWTATDEISWTCTLPYNGTYAFCILYSMPDADEPAQAWFDIETEDDFTGMGFEVYPTDGEDDFVYAGAEIELPAETVTITLYPSLMPDGEDFFINMQQMEIHCLYTEDNLDDTDNDPDDTVSTDPLTGPGWWVRPDGYVSEGLSIVDYFQLDQDTMTWTNYNMYGESGVTLGYELFSDLTNGDYILSLDLEITTADFLVDGNQLLDPDTGSVEFVYVEESPFVGEELNFDGCWYHNGDPDSTYYELSDGTYQKVEGGQVVDQGEYALGNTMVCYNEYALENVLKLSLEGDFPPDLFPNSSSTYFFEEDGFDYTLYVREEACVHNMMPIYHFVGDALLADTETDVDDSTRLKLQLTPYCFAIVTYEVEGYSSMPAGSVYGQWSITGPETILFEFEDGTSEEAVVDFESNTLHMDSLQVDFQIAEF